MTFYDPKYTAVMISSDSAEILSTVTLVRNDGHLVPRERQSVPGRVRYEFPP
jgi:hypothetical protein